MSVNEMVVKYHFSFERPNFNKLKLGKLMPFQYRSYRKNIPYWPLNHVSSVSHFDISGGTIKKIEKQL